MPSRRGGGLMRGDILGQSVARDAVDRAAELAGRLLVALIAFAVLALLVWLARPLVRAVLDRRGRASFTRVYLSLYGVAGLVVAFLLAMTLAFPSVAMVDLLTSLGILSVAAGFAFRDVLENLLAGALLLLRDPFQAGDEIRAGEFEGRVEGVTARETIIRTFDGRRVLLPNARIGEWPLEVLTHFGTARLTFLVPIDAAADPVRARDVAAGALEDTPGVLGDPPPRVVLIRADADRLILECRLWTASDRASGTAVLDGAIAAVVAALRAAGIPPPEEVIRIETGDRPARRG